MVGHTDAALLLRKIAPYVKNKMCGACVSFEIFYIRTTDFKLKVLMGIGYFQGGYLLIKVNSLNKIHKFINNRIKCIEIMYIIKCRGSTIAAMVHF